MSRTERSFKVLEAIVDEYIRTGEPIASKLLTQKLDFGVSPATIRNEMAFLEAGGYLEQPHTSAGRIPTVKGYRTYIERLLPQSPQFKVSSTLSEEDKTAINAVVEGIGGDSDELIIENASHALAELTKCAVVSASRVNRFSVITKVDVIPTGRRVYMLLLITSGGGVRNRVCRLSFDLNEEQLAFFTTFANENLSGKNLENLSQEYIDEIGVALGSYMMSLSPLLKAVADLSEEMTAGSVKFEGQSNLVAFEDLQKSEIQRILENSSVFTELLENAFSEVSVILGGENERGKTFAVENSGLITGNFKKDGKDAGSFGVIGPMRLDYKKLIPFVDYFAEQVTKLLSGDSE